ncbi:uncharacterized protein BX663DRAFT_527690 [Cokeromyces recurvatus]|uniref:uncharacterized protein n=1 Tax=Cokeromyces recurvatus TaxID=90255 RepID=UPI00221F6088|nr:uncharacterized protein BX663DRAFT_527690 [Cokeromyces recurvatus]KAI7897610.1 hypothetical protein BX663DRAFT_527690 [Cokeromyces recurvatus]
MWMSISTRRNVIKQTASLFASRNYVTIRRQTFESLHKDNSIRLIFDDPQAWKHTQSTNASTPVGLFENPYFANPQSIDNATKQAIQRAQLIVERISNAPKNGLEEMQKVVKNLDRLSDTLCSVIDIAEFTRNAHPDRNMMEAANKAYSDLCSYMHTLNIDARLHQVLSMVLADKSIVNQFKPDEHAAAIAFLRDFEKSGIHLPKQKKEEYVLLSDQIIQLGRDFIQMNPRSVHHVRIPTQSLVGLNSNVIESLPGKGGFSYISTDSNECRMILKYVKNESVRRLVYEAMNSATKESIMVLEELMRTRARLATLVGRSSYAELQLLDKMAKSPKNVETFLKTLLRHQAPAFKKDLEKLQNMKQTELHQSALYNKIQAWDREYYMNCYNSIHRTPVTTPYFSLGSVIQTLSGLFKQLYGVEFQHVPLKPGEAWHEQVRKLDVVCEEEGKIGTIYCDLFARPHKTTSAAHYTIRTSRRVDNDDLQNDIKYSGINGYQGNSILTGERIRGQEGLYQLPAIVLTCDFTTSQPTYLSLMEIETLFHEMGHAMHSMLGRTDFHNVAGTRCASDFVELPSILMEQFVWHPQVLQSFSNKTIPSDTLHSLAESRQRFKSLEVNSQILMALVDQVYHSDKVNCSSFSSVKEWHRLQDQMGLFPSVSGTMWPVQFGHLFGYGSNYYSYLFDRALAKRIWETSFEKNPFNRERGQAFRDHLLKWGGSRDPWKCVADVLGGEDGAKLANGDEEAMKIVGDWGINA